MAHLNTELPPHWDRIFAFLNRIVVWAILIGIVFLLRSFFLLIFLTFVFTYIQNRSVQRLEILIKRRMIRVVLVGMIFLGILTGIGLYIVPEVKKQSEMFIRQFGTYVARVDQELIYLGNRYPILKEAVPQLKEEEKEGDSAEEGAVFSPTTSIVQQILGIGDLNENLVSIGHIFDRVQDVGRRLVAIASAFMLSLLFSFLIVYDLPSLTERVRALEHTRLRFIYVEVAGMIYRFSQVLGQAIEAQFIIALVNSVLTALGMRIIGLKTDIAFLSMIVFLCSFVPVAGVFISSVPICLVALQMLGMKSMILAIVMIVIIHMVEGYILNPRIYGAHLRINPVIVLFILTIAGKLFHVWGLVLGVPVFSYIFGSAIALDGPQGPVPRNADPPSAAKSKRRNEKKG
jgi:predicted PurR-regulated permease PerM